MSSRSSKRLSHKILHQLVPELRESQFYKQDFRPVLLKTLDRLGVRKFEQIICYGLGSFHVGTEVASRYQLALLFLIHDELVTSGAPLNNVIEIFDPSFESLDLETLKTFSQVKFHMIDKNEHCARKIESNTRYGATLVYMPHLDKHFYNNLLGANWYLGSIERLVILGNSFQAMIDYEPSLSVRKQLYYMNLLVSNFQTNKALTHQASSKINNSQEVEKSAALIELMIESRDVEYWEIFNNLAFHFINESWLDTNKVKIEQRRIIDWDKLVVTNSDSEWRED